MKRVKNIKNGKAADTLYLRSEMLKWTGPVAKTLLPVLLNQAIAQDIPRGFQDNWIKKIFKGGNRY